jgi:hypothetical protein
VGSDCRIELNDAHDEDNATRQGMNLKSNRQRPELIGFDESEASGGGE